MSNNLPKWMQDKFKDPYDFERDTASRLPEGRREIASGAFSGHFDSGNADWMIDNKLVGQKSKAKSYSLNLPFFKTIEKKALEEGKLPAMMINYDYAGETLVVIRAKDFYGMVDN